MIKDLQPNKDKICRMTRNESNFTSDYNNSDLQTVIIYFLIPRGSQDRQN